jgi:hypothetical protein
MAENGHVFDPTPIMWDFMQDESFVRVLYGPVGSGKSICCIHELFKRALQQAPNSEGKRKTRFLIVRNTWDQLRSTVQKSAFDWFQPGVWGDWKASEKTFYMNHTLPDGSRVLSEFLYMSLDEPADVKKVLSLELTGCYGNEMRELRPDIVDGLLMRLRRYPSKKDGGPSWSGAIFDTNPPDESTWLQERLENPPENWAIFKQPPAILKLETYIAQEGEEPDYETGIYDSEGVRWYVNPRCDNLKNLDPEYYRALVPGKSVDYIRVYLRALYGRSLSGLPVYDKSFNEQFHVAATDLTPLKSPEHPIIIGQDLGRTPAAVLVQRNAFGQLVVLDELNSVNMGIETFLNTKLAPLLSREEYLGCTFVVAPDPAGWAKQQIGEVSPVDVIKRAGFKVVRPVSNTPEVRVEAVERALLRHVDGKPAFVVNPRCKELLKGFRYGYRYKLNRQGYQDDTPDKNAWSHGADACQYAVLVAEAGVSGTAFNRGPRAVVSASVSSRAWT